MKALTDKIIELLQDKHDAFLGTDGQKSRQSFKNGLSWAIETIETLERQAEFEEIARMMMKHLGDGGKYHPHHTVIITNTMAELVEGKCSTGRVEDYVPN